MKTFTHHVDDELELELVHRSHAGEVFALVESCRAYLGKWLDWVPENTSVDDSAAWIEHCLRRRANGTLISCLVRYHGDLCGTYGLYMSPRHGHGELGYWLGEQFQGNGIIARCTPVMTRLGLGERGLARLMIRAATNNAPSRRIPERFGWTYEGTMRSAIELNDERIDMRLYSVLADEVELPAPTQIGLFTRPIDDELALELFHDGFAEQMFELVDRNREHLAPRLGFVNMVDSADDARGFMVEAMKRYADGTAVRCAIRRNDELVGAVGLESIDHRNRTGEIGYWVAKDHGGNGIATRAAAEMLRFAFDVEGLERVEIRMATDNDASRRVAERLGATHEGVARQSGRVGDEVYDADVFSMLRPEWRKR